jgi:hypothetical protein
MVRPAPSIFLKRGSTFSLAGYVTLPLGTWTASSEIKDNSGNLVSDLDVTLEAPEDPETRWAILLFKDAEITADWPLGPLPCDIRFVNNDTVIYSPTFIVNIVQEVTDPQPTLILRGGNV